MAQSFPTDIEEFIEREIASGRYASRDEVMLEGIRLLKQDREEALQGVSVGLESMERGEGVPLDEAFAEIRAKHNIEDDA